MLKFTFRVIVNTLLVPTLLYIHMLPYWHSCHSYVNSKFKCFIGLTSLYKQKKILAFWNLVLLYTLRLRFYMWIGLALLRNKSMSLAELISLSRQKPWRIFLFLMLDCASIWVARHHFSLLNFATTNLVFEIYRMTDRYSSV